MSESVRTALSLFLDIYELDCRLSGDDEKRLYVKVLHRIAELPWESKAKYSPLGALLPYVGPDKVELFYLEDVHQFKGYIPITLLRLSSVTVCLATCISLCLHVCFYGCLLARLSVYLSMYSSLFFLPVCLSICLSLSVSVSLPF